MLAIGKCHFQFKSQGTVDKKQQATGLRSVLLLATLSSCAVPALKVLTGAKERTRVRARPPKQVVVEMTCPAVLPLGAHGTLPLIDYSTDRYVGGRTY